MILYQGGTRRVSADVILPKAYELIIYNDLELWYDKDVIKKGRKRGEPVDGIKVFCVAFYTSYQYKTKRPTFRSRSLLYCL